MNIINPEKEIYKQGITVLCTTIRQKLGKLPPVSNSQPKLSWPTQFSDALCLFTPDISTYQIAFNPITQPSVNYSNQESFWKHWGKMRKCWPLAVSPLPAIFSNLLRANHLCQIKAMLLKKNSQFLRVQINVVW